MREDQIIEIVSHRKKIEVSELADILGVSKVTIRKDLDKLEGRGIIHRQHGFAELNNQDDLNYRLAQNYDVKRKIAKAAAEKIRDGEVVMIESGSTCALLAEELAFRKKDITIITNSCFIAAYVRKAESVHVILLGGEYQKESQVNVGPLIKTVISEFHVDKLFIGVDGVGPKGFASNDISRCDATQTLSRSADQTIVLTDASKFTQNGLISEFEYNDISQLYTEDKIPAAIKEQLALAGVKVITV